MENKVQAYTQDVFTCFKVSLKLAIIPIVLGAVIGFFYLMFTGNPITLISILAGIRSAGLIFACMGLFICAIAFLNPSKYLRPLAYEKKWKLHLAKFGLVGTIFCIFILEAIYFLAVDVILWMVV